MLHGFGSFPGSPWSSSTSKSTGLEPMPLSNQTCFLGPPHVPDGQGKAADLKNRPALHLLIPFIFNNSLSFHQHRGNNGLILYFQQHRGKANNGHFFYICFQQLNEARPHFFNPPFF
jgi:hypothetical protein